MRGRPPTALCHKPELDRRAPQPEFADVRQRLRRFVLPATAGFLLFVVLSALAPGLMAVPVLTVINLGMVPAALEMEVCAVTGLGLELRPS